MAVFTFITAAASGIFVSALKTQRSSLAYREIIDQTSYLEDYMSRAIRMARKERSAPACLSGNNLNYEETRSGNGLKFVNYLGYCQEFFLDTATNRLKETKSGPVGTEEFLTSDSLNVSIFNIQLTGQSQNDDIQPRVTLFLDIKGKEQSKIQIQTTISQRNLDIRR